MKCQNCGENEANVRYTQIVNGSKEEMYLCDRCANKMKLNMNFKFGFDDIFSSFFAEPTLIKPFEISEGLVCDACGMRYDDFAKNGMLGCENCYRVFNRRLDNVIKKLHGSNRHIEDDDRPKGVATKVKDKKKTVKEEIEELKEKLNNCIKCEDYEQAAILRDKIKKLEKSLNDRERGE